MTTKLMYGTVEYKVDGGTAIINIKRPRLRNALTSETRQGLANLFDTCARDEHVSSVVLASSENAFSSGQDLNEARDFAPQHIDTWIDEHMRLYKALLKCPKPVVAAIDGCCVGAGLQLALLADVRIGSPAAYFIMPELDDGIPCILGVWTLWDTIGRARTTEMVLCNRRVLADEAAAWGLVSRIVPTDALLGQCLATATVMASKAPLAFRLTKDRLADLLMKEAEALSTHAKFAHMTAFASGDPMRAMDAFLRNQRGQQSVA